MRVKTHMGLERFEVAKNSSATTSLSDLTILSFEKISLEHFEVGKSRSSYDFPFTSYNFEFRKK